MIVAVGLIASRLVHYAALMILFGAAFFPVYTYDGMAPSVPETAAHFLRSRRMLLAAAITALISGIFWLGFVAANMSGDLSALFDATTLSLVIRTDFGMVWAFRLVLASGLVLLLLARRATLRRIQAVLFGSLILLASIAWTGHSGADAGPAGLVHRISDAFHLLAAGVWIGALVVLARLTMTALRELRDEDLQTLHHALSRFSGMGTVVVAILVLTGINNPGFLSSFGIAYGQVLLAKLAMFGAMLLLAAANRFWLTPRLFAALSSRNRAGSAMAALRMSVLAETALAMLVLAAVAWMGTLSPNAQQ